MRSAAPGSMRAQIDAAHAYAAGKDHVADPYIDLYSNTPPDYGRR